MYPNGSKLGLILVVAVPMIVILVSFVCALNSLILLNEMRQKTRNPQQRRPYMGTRSRTSLPTSEPTIYVSPANLPPPPKYEAMAPPSYEEVVGIHYPAYQPSVQPISQPISTALAHNSELQQHSNPEPTNSNETVTINVSNSGSTNGNSNETTITTIDERRPAVTCT